MAKSPLKGIIWDAGLVMFFWPKDQDWDYHWGKVPRVRPFFENRPLREALSIVVGIQHRLETGQINTDGHRLELSKAFGLTTPLSWEEYRLAMLDGAGFSLNVELLEVQDNLTRLPYIRQSLISNLWPMMHQVLDRAGALRGINGPQLFSYSEKMMKPSAELLRRALKAIDCAPDETLVIDDNAGNIAAAHKFGCRTHLYTENSALADDFARNGLPPMTYFALYAGDRRRPLAIKWDPPSL